MEKFRSPSLLQAGDKIAIVAPGRKTDRHLVDRAVSILQNWGLQVSLSENLFSQKHSYLAGSDQQRLTDLQQALNDDSIRAVLCARGGYGSSRVVDQLDLSPLLAKPKWIIGFSDITAIHLRLVAERIRSIHATMPVLFSRADSITSVESLRKLLFHGVSQLHANPSEFNRSGDAAGICIGGNLSLIVDSLGTAAEISTRNKILIIEEIDEYYYKVDRMMTQLKRAGKLATLRGLVVGHMTDLRNGELNFAARMEDVVLDAVSQYDYPVAFGFPTGHENPNLAWVEGGEAILTVNPAGSTLKFTNVTSLSDA